MGFLKKLQATLSDETKFGSDVKKIMFSTGIDSINLLGAKAGSKDDGIKYGLYKAGIVGVIGKSGTAKSSFILQTMWDIAKKYEDSSIIWEDFEDSLDDERIYSFTGLDMSKDDDRAKFTHKTTGISIESVFRTMQEVYKNKMEYYGDKKNLIDNKEGYLDDNNNPIKIMPPTFIVLDSVRAMTSKNISLADNKTGEMATSNMTPAQIAKELGVLARQAIQLCAEANIVLVYVNHIQTDINTGHTPKPKYLSFLAMGETIPGGNQLIYLTGTLIKLIHRGNISPDDKTSSYGTMFNVKGYNLEAFLVKSRDTAAGQGIDLIFDQYKGFDNDFCNYVMLENKKIIQAAGAYKKLTGYDKNFRSSELKEKLQSDVSFKEVWDKAVQEALMSSVYIPAKQYEADLSNVNDKPEDCETQILHD